MTGEHEPSNIDDILNLSREQAAGGVCSLRVLNLINIINNLDLKSIESAPLHGPDGYLTECKYSPIKTLGTAGDLVVIPTKAKNKTVLGYLHNPTKQLIELWHLIEREDADDCSYAVFVPTLDTNVQIDYSLVVTRDDESRHVDEDALIHDLPLTNAIVLEELIKFLKRGSNELPDLIKLNELIKYYSLSRSTIEANSIILADKLEINEPKDALVRQLGRIAGLASLSYKPGNIIKRHNLNDSEIILEISPDGITNIRSHHADLGRHGRTTHWGSLVLKDNDVFGVSEIGTEESLKQAAELALGIPEIIDDTDLKSEIHEVISSSIDPNYITDIVKNLIDEYRKNHKLRYDTIIDMGIIDLTHIPQTSDRQIVFKNFNYVKSKVIANKGLEIFEDCNNLYECIVIGARKAFYKKTGFSRQVRCTAEDVYNAFYNSETIECIAKKCNSAFQYAVTEGCLAIDVYYAFSDSSSRNSVAEHCKYSFTNPSNTSNLIGNCKSINPNLFGRSFNLNVYQRNGKNIYGRVIGKRASKLRGKYRTRK